MGFLSDMFKGSGGSLVGGTLGAVAGLINQKSANDHAMDVANMNIALQKEFAQNSIKWRVEDAKRAGLHPMAALGISPSSFSPVSAPFASNGLETMLSDMGQNVDRAALAAKDAEAREEALAQQQIMDTLNQQKVVAEINLLNAEADSKRSVASTALPPAAPSVNPKKVSPLGASPSNPASLTTFHLPPPNKTGMISRKDAAFHVWHMGNNEYDINFNPDYTQTMGDELGQFVNAYHNAKRDRFFTEPETGEVYVYNPDSGYFNLLRAMSDHEIIRLFTAYDPDSRGFDPASYAKTFHVGY